jgi:hypothetical protein
MNARTDGTYEVCCYKASLQHISLRSQSAKLQYNATFMYTVHTLVVLQNWLSAQINGKPQSSGLQLTVLVDRQLTRENQSRSPWLDALRPARCHTIVQGEETFDQLLVAIYLSICARTATVTVTVH